MMNETGNKQIWQHPGWLACGVALLALLAYANSLPGAFILDDNTIVVENPLVARIDLWRIFTTDYWGVDLNSGLFRPLTILSFGLNRLLLGAAPAGFHIVNIALHAGVATLLFVVVRQITARAEVALLAACLFAVHPIHTEVVDQVVGRGELLAALFVLAGLWTAQQQSWKWNLLGTAFLFGVALLSKENGIVLLALVPGVDYFTGQLRRDNLKRRCVLYLLLGGIVVLWLAWRAWGVEHRVPPDLVEPPFAPLVYMEPVTRILTALKIQWFYIWKLIWPADLQAVYAGERWLAPVVFWSPTGIAISAGTSIALTAVFQGCRRGSWIGRGALLYLITFLPTSNLVLPIGVSMAERLTYLPSAWFCLAIAAVAAPVANSRSAVIAMMLTVAVLTGVTWERNRDYADAVTLWSEAVERDPSNPVAWLYLGESYYNAGDMKHADETFHYQEKSINDFNNRTIGYTNYLYQRGNFASAIRVGLRLEEQGESSSLNRMVLARSYLALGQLRDAWHWLESSREQYEDYALYWKVRGEISAAQGDATEAIEDWTHAMSLATYDDLPLEVVKLLVSQKRFVEAEGVARQLLNRVCSANAWNALGITLAEQKRYAEAADAFDRAFAIDPTDALLRDNAARARSAAAGRQVGY